MTLKKEKRKKRLHPHSSKMMTMRCNSKVNMTQFMMIHLLKRRGKMHKKKKSRRLGRTKMNMLMIWKESTMTRMPKCKKFLNKASCKISLNAHMSIKK
jgi:2,3-bisphosphoglycerate-independent phosphoglycerate mutase